MLLRLVLIGLLLLPTRLAAQEKVIDRLVAKHGISADGPGAAVAVVEPGKETFRKGYGLANLAKGTPITSYTTFELASLSKPITALLLLLLVERGLLSLDDDVRKYVPELPEYFKNRPIRVRNLLTHTSGLPEYLDMEDPDLPPGRKFRTNEDYVPAFKAQRKEFPATFAPDAKHEYCNSNYLLLAAIAARVTRKPFGLLVRDEILQPLQMTSSFVYSAPNAVVAHPRHGFVNAVAYEWRKKKKTWVESWGAPPYRSETALVAGDGSVWSSLEDMERFDAALRAGKILKAKTMAAALLPTKTRDGELNDYGLGWVLDLDDDGKLISYGHSGSWGGFRTAYYRHLPSNRSFIVLSNRGNFDPDELIDALIEVLGKKKN